MFAMTHTGNPQSPGPESVGITPAQVASIKTRQSHVCSVASSTSSEKSSSKNGVGACPIAARQPASAILASGRFVSFLPKIAPITGVTRLSKSKCCPCRVHDSTAKCIKTDFGVGYASRRASRIRCFHCPSTADARDVAPADHNTGSPEIKTDRMRFHCAEWHEICAAQVTSSGQKPVQYSDLFAIRLHHSAEWKCYAGFSTW